MTPLLRRPFSIAGISRSKPNQANKHSAPATSASPGANLYIEIIYRVLGPGTTWLKNRKIGDGIDLLGPLGNGFTLPADTSTPCILLGGGVGLVPLFFLADQLAKAGQKSVFAFAGAVTKNHFAASLATENIPLLSKNPLNPQLAVQQFNRSGTGCVIATDDGSLGFAGTVTEALNEYISRQQEFDHAQIYACGPTGMLKAISDFAARRDLHCQLCMEAYMACGIGVCQSCAVPVKNGTQTQPDKDAGIHYKLVCSDGPVFDSKIIKWD